MVSFLNQNHPRPTEPFHVGSVTHFDPMGLVL